jgi:hypothetical protein
MYCITQYTRFLGQQVFGCADNSPAGSFSVLIFRLLWLVAILQSGPRVFGKGFEGKVAVAIWTGWLLDLWDGGEVSEMVCPPGTSHGL